MAQFLADLQLQASRHGLVILARLKLFREVILTGGIGIGLVVGVAVFFAVAQLLHQLGRCVAKVQRHFQRAMFGRLAQRGLEAHVHRIALRCAGDVGDGLGHCQLAFGAAQAFLHVPGGQAQAQGSRVGVADVLAGHAHHATGDVQRVAAAVEHACEPVQGAIGVGAAHRLVQRGNLVVERLAALVETPPAVAEQALQHLDVDLAAIFGKVRGILEEVEHAPAIAIGGRHEHLEGVVTDAQVALAQPALFRQRTVDQFAQRRFVQALEHIDPRPRQQGVV